MFATPSFLWLLVVPPIVVWLARARRRPRLRDSGAIEIWRELAERTAQAQATRARTLPAWLVLWAAGACALILALAGPVVATAASSRPATLAVDMRPGVFLRYGEPGAPLGPTTAEPQLGDTRIARALELAWPTVLELAAQAGGRLELRLGRAAPIAVPVRLDAVIALLEVAEVDPRTPEPSRDDRPEVLWILAEAPSVPLRSARWVRPAASPVPGFVAPDLWFDGTGVERRAGPEDERGVMVVLEDRRHALLARFAETWARTRGLSREEIDRAARLRVGSFVGERSDIVRWSASRFELEVELEGGGDDLADPRSEVWLRAADGTPLVLGRPGEVRFALGEWRAPGGDQAAFALALGELLDRALLPPRGIVSAAARAAWTEHLPKDREEDGEAVPAPSARWPTWLCAVAGSLLLALAALRVPRL